MFITFDGIKNARELGGIAVHGGRKLKSGVLIRSAGLGNASDGDIRRLSEEMRLRHIVDFRDGLERGRFPDRDVPGADYHALPALPTFKDRDKRNASAEIPDFDATFAAVNGNLASCAEAKAAYAEFFRILLEAGGGAVLWHCTQGKDRTGMAAVLLLTALGADWADIEKDYFLSNEGLKYLLSDPVPEHMQRWPEEVRRKLYFVYPHFLELFLDKVGETYGGLEGYLAAIGVGEAEKARLREYYTE